jgi:hypothetical protein
VVEVSPVWAVFQSVKVAGFVFDTSAKQSISARCETPKQNQYWCNMNAALFPGLSNLFMLGILL